MATQIGTYRTVEGNATVRYSDGRHSGLGIANPSIGIAAFDKNGLTWRIEDQAPEKETPAEAGIPVPLVATTEPLVHKVTTPLPETEWTGGEDQDDALTDPFAGIEEEE